MKKKPAIVEEKESLYLKIQKLSNFIKSEEFDKLEKKEMKLLTKHIGYECSCVIRPNWLNIVDGEF